MNYKSRTGASSSRVVVKEEEGSSFFPVPSHLVKMYGGVMPSKVSLTTDESSKRWKLSIEKFDGYYFFTDGWKEFEEAVDLESRKFLMYKPNASSKQKGCSKAQEIRDKLQPKCSSSPIFLGKKNEEKRSKISGNAYGTTKSSINENKKTGSDDEKRLSFSKEMKKYHQYRLDIPGTFVRSTGLCEKDIIVLRNTEGKEWPVHVTKRAAVFSLCGGWIEFVADSKVMIGSKISFVWLSESTILARILEVGTGTQLLINSTSRRAKQLELLELSDNSFPGVKNENEADISKTNSVGVGKKWRCTKVLNKANAHSLDFPVSFSTVIGKKTSGEIELMDCEKRIWPVKYNRRTSFRLTTGWIDFLVANKASVGSTVVFESIPGCKKMVEARVMNGGSKHRVLFVKKPRGRPRSKPSMSS